MPTALTHIGHGFNSHPGQSIVCGIVPAVTSRPGFYLPLVSINLLRSLHWLRVPERISFRLAMWCIAASMVLHLATWRQISSASLTLALVGDCAVQVRQHSSVHVLYVLPSATVPSRQLPHLFGTVSSGIAIAASFSW